MNKDGKHGSKSLKSLLSSVEAFAVHHAVLLFVLLLAAVYGFVAVKITAYSNAQPSPADVASQIKAAATPNVSQSLVRQMQSLQDHSVNVKALFDKARSNPFQE